MTRLPMLLARKEQRDGKRYKQKEIAAETGLSPATISRWFAGDIESSNLATVKVLCQWLDCEIGELVAFQKESA